MQAGMIDNKKVFPNKFSLQISKIENLLLFLILLCATILRVWNPLHLPYIYDEFSALFRTQYHTLHDLVEYGIKPDNHPPLIQIFLFFWVKLWGFNPFAVKLPFIIMGVCSVWLVFRLGKQWFSTETGLIASAYFATLQYSILYSQLARPYVSGVFLCLMLVWYWDKIMLHSNKNFYKNLILYIVFASLCSFNHYFSLLFAIIVSLSGLFFIKRSKLLYYMLAGFVILLLYIPYLPIFMEQFQRKGIESWLGKPHAEFIVDYFRNVFHFSYLTFGFALLIVVLGSLFFRTNKFNWRMFVISLIWFFTPYIIGYIYSIKVSALLQFSLLLFGFPFMLFAMFGHLHFKKQWMSVLVILLILTINISSLCFNRKHYTLFYKVPYEQILLETENDFHLYGDSITRIIDSDHKISNYYQQKNNLTTAFVWADSFSSLSKFNEFLGQQKTTYLSFGCLSASDPVLIPMIMNYYPNMLKQLNMFSGSYYLFSKVKPRVDSLRGQDSSNLYSSTIVFPNLKAFDSLDKVNNNDFGIELIPEFSKGFVLPLVQLMQSKTNFIDITLEYIALDTLQKVCIVSELSSHDTVIDWRATKLSQFEQSLSWHQTKKCFHSIKLSDIYLHYPDIILKVYVWNPAKERLLLRKLQLKTRMGNPIIYGLYDKIW